MPKSKPPNKKLRASLKKKRKFDYLGTPEVLHELLHPDEHRGAFGLSSEERSEAAEAHIQQMDEDCDAIVELLQDYKIPLDSSNLWQRLALALAKDNVPAFQMEVGPRGRRRRWKKEKEHQLYSDVQSALPRAGGNERQACNFLTNKYGMEIVPLYDKYKKIKKAKKLSKK